MATTQIDLYVPSDDAIAQPMIEVVKARTAARPDVQLMIKPVLDYPIEVVERQIFYAPTLVIDGRIVASAIKSPELLESILKTLL